MAGITLTGLRNSDIEGSGGGPGGSMYSGSNTGRKQGSSMVDPDDEEEDVTDSDANVEGSGIAPPPSGGSWRFPMIDPSLVEGSGESMNPRVDRCELVRPCSAARSLASV